MVQVVYVGPCAAVEVPALGIEAVRNEPVEVDDKAAKALLEQDTWREHKPSQKATKGSN